MWINTFIIGGGIKNKYKVFKPLRKNKSKLKKNKEENSEVILNVLQFKK